MIYTFYSFKGGVGRSMALANIAELLCARGRKVLIIDFDLEAPGLEHFFDVPEAIHSLQEVLGQRGVINMLMSYKELRALHSRLPSPDKKASSRQGPFPFSIEPFSNFVTEIYRQNDSGHGSLFIMPAGRRAGNELAYYVKQVDSFDWKDCLSNWEMEKFFDWFREEAQKTADIVLIDSRTGITEMGGICTHFLADVTVMFTSANYQSLKGTEMMATSLTNPELIEKGRNGRELPLLFIPSRIDLNETILLNEFAKQFDDTFSKLYPSELQLENPFVELKIPYMSYYAYKENVAVREANKPAAKYLAEAFEKLVSVFMRLASEDIMAADFDLAQYARRIKERYHALDLSALTPPARDDVEDSRISLRDIFLPQNVRESRPPRELPKELEHLYAADPAQVHNAWTSADSEPVLEALTKSQNKRLVLLGDPGSGKSTLARYLLLCALEPPLDEDYRPLAWAVVLCNHLPLLVELCNYVGGKIQNSPYRNFVEYFHHLGITEKYGLNHLQLKEYLKTRPSLVIFDGLDEIFDPRARENVTREIIGFAGFYPLTRVVVTSRVIGYQGSALRAAEFREYTLQELDENQIHAFAQGWFRLVFTDHPEEVQFRQKRIKDAIQHSPAIRQLAGNPLLLTMIAIIAKHQELPRDRAKLYEHASKVLCYHWDVTGKHIAPSDTPADFMRENDKLELLRYIARRMQSGPKGLAGNFILATELLEEVEKYMAHRWQLQPVNARRVGLAVVNQLRERNFILCLWGGGVYGFVHRTFLEYFCATDIVHRFTDRQELSFEQLKSDIFLKNYQDNTWHEVLRLICGLVAPRFAGSLIDAIVPKRKQAFKKTDALILAVQCLSEVGNLNKIRDTASRVLEGILGWFEHQDRHKAVEPVKKEQAFLENAVPMVENIGTGWPGREVVIKWLPDPKKEICSFNGTHAFGRAVKALCSDNEKTKEGLITLSDIIVRKSDSYMAFDALARSFGKQKEIYSLLCRRAVEGEHEGIRAAALNTLAEHYVEAADTRGLLRQRAVEDDDWHVRNTALGVLAKYYTDSSDTRSLVRKQAVEDRHENVRDAALRILVKHYFDAPDTYALLHQCASGDGHERVRNAAMGGLLKYHEEYWQILLSRDLDKREPWLDAIDKKQVAKAVGKLKKLQTEIYREYESIAQKLPVKLNWKDSRI